MKISDIQIDGFGVWSQLRLDHLAEGMTVFYGPNEAGKTTLLEFIRSVLYGFSPERRARYLPPAGGGRPGGSLGLVDRHGRFEVRRSPGSGFHADDPGKVEVLSGSGTRQGQHLLANLLSGIDEAIFNNVFAVGLREVQELGTLDDTEAATQLYRLTSGLDRVSLVDVMRDLDAAREKLLAAEGSPSLLAELLERRERLQREVREREADGQRWAQLLTQRNGLRDEAARLEESIARMDRESRAVDVALRVRGDWQRRAAARQKLEKLGPRVELPERLSERLDALNEQIRADREQIEQLRRARRVIVDEAATQPLNRLLWNHASRVEAAIEHAPWIASLENQIGHLHEEIIELEQQLRGHWEQLGLKPEDLPDFTPEFSQRTLNTVRGPARSVRESIERLESARKEREAAELEAEQLREQLAADLADTGEPQLEAALEAAGKRVTNLHRRVQVEERLEKLERHRKELEEDRRDLVEEQILPVPTLVWCGVPFVLGVTLILASIFWESVARLGWTITVLGFVCWAIAVATKVLLERSAGRELDACTRQLEKLKRQLREVKDERDQLDRQLPAGGGPLDARVAAAEQYVKRLEELTPLETRHQAAMNRAAAVRDKETRAGEDLREARARWREALRSVNLPESFQPEHIQHFSEGSDQTLQVARRLQSRREELQSREEELLALTARIDQLMVDVKIKAASDDPKTQLRQITAALDEQRQWIARRSELKASHRELRKEFRTVARRLQQAQRQRGQLIHQAGETDEAELRKLAARQEKIAQLSAELRQLDERIALVLGNQSSEKAVGEILEAHAADRLEPYRDRLAGRLEEARERLSQLHQHRGEMNQEMKSLAEDRRLLQARMHLECVEGQIREAIRQWRVLAVTSAMLEAIRQIYETERQPETLAEASRHLDQLTEGRYRRVWTPLSEDVLRIDTAGGDSLPLDVLSQGTREAVFISLRLALASAYARRGAVLPLVLDDVLVNFDTRRAQRAAKVLRDFALTGHQLLLFTCHEHIVRIFEAVEVEVRRLPVREGLAASLALEEANADELPSEPARLAARAAEAEAVEDFRVEDEAAVDEGDQSLAEVDQEDPDRVTPAVEAVAEEATDEQPIDDESEGDEAATAFDDEDAEEEGEPDEVFEEHRAGDEVDDSEGVEAEEEEAALSRSEWDDAEPIPVVEDALEVDDPWEGTLLAVGDPRRERWWEDEPHGNGCQ